VGASALEGLDGVTDVTKGFKGSKEINTVTYDPSKVSIEQMTEALEEAGTYRGLAE
jgi:copper chaperone CopZ